MHSAFAAFLINVFLTLHCLLMKIIHYSIMHVCVRALLQELPSLGVLIIMRNILTCSGKELTTLHSLENKKSLRLYSAAHTLQVCIKVLLLSLWYAIMPFKYRAQSIPCPRLHSNYALHPLLTSRPLCFRIVFGSFMKQIFHSLTCTLVCSCVWHGTYPRHTGLDYSFFSDIN